MFGKRPFTSLPAAWSQSAGTGAVRRLPAVTASPTAGAFAAGGSDFVHPARVAAMASLTMYSITLDWPAGFAFTPQAPCRLSRNDERERTSTNSLHCGRNCNQRLLIC
jgi:hypothetical protein